MLLKRCSTIQVDLFCSDSVLAYDQIVIHFYFKERLNLLCYTWMRGAGRLSGSWGASLQGPGIPGYFDGNAAERAPSDPHWEKQTPLRRAKSS